MGASALPAAMEEEALEEEGQIMVDETAGIAQPESSEITMDDLIKREFFR